MTSTSCTCSLSRPIRTASFLCGPSVSAELIPRGNIFKGIRNFKGCGVRDSMLDSQDGSASFIKRVKQAWLISQQPKPIACNTCDNKGCVECKWCRGTGFFILGDNMLCQVPSRNTSCVICAGKGSTCCSDCKGTGFRAKWLEAPPISK